MNENLNSLLYECTDGTIKNFDFDFKNNRIIISVNVEHIDRSDDYHIILFNVSSFYFINDEGDSRINFAEPDRVWVTTFYLCQERYRKNKY